MGTSGTMEKNGSSEGTTAAPSVNTATTVDAEKHSQSSPTAAVAPKKGRFDAADVNSLSLSAHLALTIAATERTPR